MPARLEALLGRIETLAVDAVVNAANARLLPGSGVDGALRAAAGPQLTRATSELGPLSPGEAVITPGFAAPARFIIHTAAPIWRGGEDAQGQQAELAACYASVIALANQHELAALAFPCLGTGVYAWPRERACAIALSATRAALTGAPALERVIFCCFSAPELALYKAALAAH